MDIKIEKLKKVADFLKNQVALEEYDCNMKEAFVRSACSRYYYSAFYLIKNELLNFGIIKINKSLQHKDVGDEITKIYRAAEKKFKKDKDHLQYVESLKKHCTSLKKLMKTARQTRTFADYDLNQNIGYDKENKKYKIENESLCSISKWHDQTEKTFIKIKEVRKHLGYTNETS